MPSVTVRPLDLDAHIRGALECSVCLLPYNTTTSKPVQLDPCGHCFCSECASQLHDCPYCRATISQRIPNRGLFDVMSAVDVARNSLGDSGLTTPLLAEYRSSTSDNRQCSCNCFLERTGALIMQGMSLLGRLLTTMCDEISFLLKLLWTSWNCYGVRAQFLLVTLIISHLLVLAGPLVMMRQSSVVRGYFAFCGLRFGSFVYQSRFKESPPGRRWRHDFRLVWFCNKIFGVAYRVIAFVAATALCLSALDLHTSTQSNPRWEDDWPLVNIGIGILLIVCVLLVWLICTTFREPPSPPSRASPEISWSVSASVWNLLSAAVDSFFVYLACLALVGYAYVNDDNADGPQLCPSQPCPPTGCSLFWEVVKFCDRAMAFDFCGDVRA